MKIDEVRLLEMSNKKYTIIKLLEKIPPTIRFYNEVKNSVKSDCKSLLKKRIKSELMQNLYLKYHVKINTDFVACYDDNQSKKKSI